MNQNVQMGIKNWLTKSAEKDKVHHFWKTVPKKAESALNAIMNYDAIL